MNAYDNDVVEAIAEYCGCGEEEAIDKIDGFIIYADREEYFNMVDELVDMELKSVSEHLRYYFDYDLYHRDCLIDVYEADNGIIIVE